MLCRQKIEPATSKEAVSAIGQLVTEQIEDDLHASIGQDAFPSPHCAGRWQYQRVGTHGRKMGLGADSR